MGGKARSLQPPWRRQGVRHGGAGRPSVGEHEVKVYRGSGDANYGKTKAGACMEETAAKAEGDRPSAGKLHSWLGTSAPAYKYNTVSNTYASAMLEGELVATLANVQLSVPPHLSARIKDPASHAATLPWGFFVGRRQSAAWLEHTCGWSTQNITSNTISNILAQVVCGLNFGLPVPPLGRLPAKLWLLGGLERTGHGHVVVVMPGPWHAAGGFSGLPEQGSYPPSMSGSMSSWQGARSRGERTVRDPWGAADWPQVTFWTRQ